MTTPEIVDVTTTSNILTQHQNGNALVTITTDGTRTIEYEGELKPEFPFNVDIRVSTTCSFADNICKGFCHESAVVNGRDCDYDKLLDIIKELPKGTELAIGCNHYNFELQHFLRATTKLGFINNLTINQGHILRDYDWIVDGINYNWVKGLGVSYRSSLKWNLPETIVQYPNTVFHVIMGIDTVNDVLSLADKGVKKVLVLGEKDFGFNEGKVDLTSRCHKEWQWWISKLFKVFDVVSFDNLAVEQLELQRFFNKDSWSQFYNGEYSFYIDAVHQVFQPSSRSSIKTDWNVGIRNYFQTLNFN